MKAVRKGRPRRGVPLGFMVWVRCGAALDAKQRDALAARFQAEAIEQNGFLCGGASFGQSGVDCELKVLVTRNKPNTSCVTADVRTVVRWRLPSVRCS